MTQKPDEATPEAIRKLGLIHNYSFCDDQTAPLIYFIHGRAGNDNVMWLFRRSLPEKVNIISLQAPLDDEIGGYSWWPVGGDKSEEYDIALQSAQKAARFTHQAPSYYDLTPVSTLAFGFSQGSGLITLLVQEEQVHLDAIAILAGFVMKRTSEPAPTWPQIFWGHGTTDEIIPIERARKDRDKLLSEGAAVEFCEEEVGHKIGSQTMKALKSWVESKL